MEKGLTISGMVVAVLILVLFAADLVIGFPFKRASTFMDIAFVIVAIGLGYLSWSTLRELE